MTPNTTLNAIYLTGQRVVDQGTQEEAAKEVNDKMTGWEAIVTMFPEGQRSWSQVKERWTRALKKRLLRKSMTR